MSATEMGQIGSSLLLTYYGGQGHRPKWIAWGMVLFAVSSFTCSLPHFIYGKQLIKATTGVIRYFSYIILEDVQLKFLIKVHESIYTNFREPNVCKAPNMDLDEYTKTKILPILNATNYINENISPNIMQTCYDEDVVPGHQIQPSVTNIVLAIFFISLLGVGMGQTAVYTLGIPYMDDNISSKQSPLYFGKCH